MFFFIYFYFFIKKMFPDLSYLSDIGQTLQNKLPLEFWEGLLFHVVNLLFNAFEWANSSRAKFKSFFKYIVLYFRGS